MPGAACATTLRSVGGRKVEWRSLTETITVLVTVKAYPALSQKHGEAVCVAGVRADSPTPEWVRLFPVPFRDLDYQRRFKKYQLITLQATKSAGSDKRPESWRPDPDSIVLGRVLNTSRNWQERRRLVLPLETESMCDLQRRQATDGTSLGVFKPGSVEDFLIEPESSDWDPAKQALIDQPSLLFPTKAGLEKIPFRFRYRYTCSTAGCRGHSQSIVDWELSQAYRLWSKQYGPKGVIDALRQKWLTEMCAPERDTYFFAGNQHMHPEAFLVLGVFWPKK